MHSPSSAAASRVLPAYWPHGFSPFQTQNNIRVWDRQFQLWTHLLKLTVGSKQTTNGSLQPYGGRSKGRGTLLPCSPLHAHERRLFSLSQNGIHSPSLHLPRSTQTVSSGAFPGGGHSLLFPSGGEDALVCTILGKDRTLQRRVAGVERQTLVMWMIPSSPFVEPDCSHLGCFGWQPTQRSAACPAGT